MGFHRTCQVIFLNSLSLATDCHHATEPPLQPVANTISHHSSLQLELIGKWAGRRVFFDVAMFNDLPAYYYFADGMFKNGDLLISTPWTGFHQGSSTTPPVARAGSWPTISLRPVPPDNRSATTEFEEVYGSCCPFERANSAGLKAGRKKTHRPQGRPKTIDLDRIQALIHDHCEAIHNLTDLASQAGIGRDTLRKEFARRMDIPVSRFIRSTRIEQAMSLLRDSDEPCYAVCFAVGFRREDVGCRVFKRLVGVGMQEYRRRQHDTIKIAQ